MGHVVVTGANGFLGSWVTRALLAEGHQVKILVRKTSDLTELEGVKVEKLYGDVTDANSVQEAFKGAESVFHLAGLIAYKRRDREPMERVNVTGTQNVVDACLDQGVRRLVHLSSVAAVGAGFTKDQILNESSSYNLGHLNLGYFETKRKSEEIVVNAFKQRGLDSVILNPSTVYGEGDARKGSRKAQIKVAQGKLKLVPPGGVSIIAVEDAVQGILSGWRKGRSGERYILSGENLLIKDAFAIIAKIAGQPAPNWQIPASLVRFIGKLDDVLALVGLEGPVSDEAAWAATLYHWYDHSKAKKELDFNPRPAEYALKKSVGWMKSNKII